MKQEIDAKIVEKPRIWPSDGMISQTGGHGDFRMTYDIPSSGRGGLSRGEQIGGVIVDGSNEVTKE